MKTTAFLLAAMLAAPVASFAHGDGTGVPGAEFLKEWDLSGTGSVTLADMQARRAEIFEMFDLNGDGQISGDEVQNMAQTVTGQAETAASAKGKQGQGGGGNGPGQMIHAAMSLPFNDADANGAITRQEFVDASAPLFAALDRNADAALTLADFGR